jgi:hypothetical protein
LKIILKEAKIILNPQKIFQKFQKIGKTNSEEIIQT